MLGNDFAIYKTVERSTAIFSYTANSPFTVLDLALIVTKIAVYLVAVTHFIERCFLHYLTPESSGMGMSYFPKIYRVAK